MTERPQHHQHVDDPRLVTIRNLLAKAEATEFPHEAETFFNKASELIARYSIDEAMVWASATRSSREQPEELRLELHSPYLTQKAVLVGAVAGAHGCRTVRLSGGAGARTEICSIIGFPADLRWVETIFTSLIVQLTSAMLAQAPTGLTSSESAAWRRSFIMGFAGEVGDRLEADRRAAARETASDNDAGSARSGAANATSLSLVLASRSGEVDDEFRRRHPRVRTSWASAGRSRSGERAGRAAGRNASFDRRNLGPRRKGLRAG